MVKPKENKQSFSLEKTKTKQNPKSKQNKQRDPKHKIIASKQNTRNNAQKKILHLTSLYDYLATQTPFLILNIESLDISNRTVSHFFHTTSILASLNTCFLPPQRF
jgi:hypothetical protein